MSPEILDEAVMEQVFGGLHHLGFPASMAYCRSERPLDHSQETVARVVGATEARKRNYGITAQLLEDHMRETNKSHWMVRIPLRGDAHQWTFLLGSNTDLFGHYKKIDFYVLNSEEAREFFPRLNLSAKQRKERSQPRLFD